MIIRNFRESTLIRALNLILPEKKSRIAILTAAQVTINILDLAGVLIFGIVGALGISGIQSKPVSGSMLSILTALHIGSMDFRMQVALLGSLGAILLISRSLVTALLSRHILHFLSFKSAQLSQSLIRQLFDAPVQFVRQRTEKVTIYAITSGVDEIALRMLGTSTVIVSDVSLLIFLSIGLFFIQPFVALSTFAFFAIVVLAMQKTVTGRASKLGLEVANLTVKSTEDIASVLEGYRVLYVHNQLGQVATKIGADRRKLSYSQAEMAFMPNISKYVIEISVVIGAIALSACQFIISDAVHAVSTLTVFLAAGTRIAPALLRAQQGAIQFKASIGSASYTIALAEDLRNLGVMNKGLHLPETYLNTNFDRPPRIMIQDLSFSFGKDEILKDISLDFAPGQMAAIVGSSGAGKSTLVDLLLGLHSPSKGKVLIDDISPKEAIKASPYLISYVPQEIPLLNGSIFNNMNFGYREGEYSEEECLKVLHSVGLGEWISNFKLGIHTQIGETGVKLSGGQKQRLALASAIICRPKILVMDEATSALDGVSEEQIKILLDSFKGQITTIVIAHRLASIRDADQIVLLEGGEVEAVGKFGELKQKSESFRIQAELMGL